MPKYIIIKLDSYWSTLILHTLYKQDSKLDP